MKILLAADGSEYTKKAAKHLVQHLSWFSGTPEVHLLHVHPRLPLPGAARAVGSKAVEKYQREESEAALAVAKKPLDKAGIAYRAVWVEGDVVDQIGAYVKKHDIDLVVMGSRGQGAFAGLALGSVATKVLASLKVPVLVVR